MKKIYLVLLTVLLSMVSVAYADSHETNRDVMKADANKDGKVSFEEFKAAHDAKMRERFKRKDVNGDGFIDLEEKQVAKEKKKAERKARKKAEKIEERQELREKYSEERKRRKKHFHKYN